MALILTYITSYFFVSLFQSNSHRSHLNLSAIIENDHLDRLKVVLEAKTTDWDSFELKARLTMSR